MKQDLVSIIIPVYNVEPFISKCIESAINQDYKNIEIILVDDGSTDKSGDICDDYAKKDNRIKVIHKKNSGVSSARNIGIEKSTGDYICFIDGDDYVFRNYVSHLRAIIGDSEIACIRQFVTPYNKNKRGESSIEFISGEDATEMILCYKLPIGVNAKLFSKEFLRQNKIEFETGLVIGEGFNFNTKSFQLAKKVSISDARIYYYRKNNSNSVTTKYNNKKWENGIYALEKIHDDLRIHSKRILNAWNYAYWRTKTDAYDLMVIHRACKEYPDMYRKTSKGIRKGFFLSLKAPISTKDRIRAFVFMIFPKIIPYCMILRKRLYHQDRRENED